MLVATNQTIRRRIQVQGIVQGVGFRPSVYNLAEALGLSGFVTNNANGVEIQIQGPPAAVTGFAQRLHHNAPPLAVITHLETTNLPPELEQSFRIIASERESAVTTLVSPDVAVCPDCLKELFDSENRRYEYPFINCTNCGPRYTIIEAIPYDRPYTSMRHFTMCPECQREYDDPRDRRFHAQPNACPVCGPQVWLADSWGATVARQNIISSAVEYLQSGQILAIKGLGGFHLAVDASNEGVVTRLRKRKRREEKPLAVMFPTLEAARQICQIRPPEVALLTSRQTPILLCPKKARQGLVTEAVAPNNSRLGIMLPYTPLHHLILKCFDGPLVMTSANYSEEPICIDNDEALRRLQGIADYFLLHNREIYLRSDDSVFAYIAGKNRPLRRSRGFVPTPVFLDSTGPVVLAVGGELKNTICLTTQNRAFLSQHIGDLENLESYQVFRKTISHLQKLLELEPALIVHDLHPDYLSTQWAQAQPLPTLTVQHHHAHLAACLAEHQLIEPVIGIILDGTGFGPDGSIWGGEILVGDYAKYRRFAHLENMLLPGGDAAIRAPWRTAAAYLAQTFGNQLPDLPFLSQWEIGPILEMVRTKTNTPLTSSMGRLFDAVAAIAGGRCEIRYEGQAAIELMQACDSIEVPPFTFAVKSAAKEYLLCTRPLIRDVVHALQDGADLKIISNRFHRTLVEWIVKIANLARRDTGLKQVVLSGGVFQNEILLAAVIPALARKGFEVFAHARVPTNDGGLALGQAMIGRQYLNSQKKD